MFKKLKGEREKTTVQIFIPCFIDQLYPNIAFAMIKVLEKVGCTVKYNINQTCCGQPAYNAGFWGESKEVCQKFVQDFSGEHYIVVPSASCAGFIKKHYPSIFSNSSLHNEVKDLQERVVEFTDFLVNILEIEHIGATFNGTATYHHSCAALRECNIKQEPLKLLKQVAGLELVTMIDEETCCGFGGTFAVKFEPISIAMGDQKVNNAAATKASCIISTDVSCLMHIDGIAKNKQTAIETIHIAEILASGY